MAPLQPRLWGIYNCCAKGRYAVVDRRIEEGIAMVSYRVVGMPTPRFEGADKVTGAARYTADVVLPNALWGKSLRSPYPYARILSIDASAARQLPGVHAVLT